MRIVALLSWYDEPVEWLVDCVKGAAKIAQHIIAVDGPYAQFPAADEVPCSPAEQAMAIRDTAADADIGCTLQLMRAPWPSEVAKRDHMFRLAETIGADWLFRIDADEYVTHVPGDLRDRLIHTNRHVAEVTLDNPANPTWPGRLRCLFRAIPGLRITQAHSLVIAPVNERQLILAGDPGAVWKDLERELEPAEQIPECRIEHRTQQRSLERQHRKDDYYRLLPELEKLTPLT